MCVWTGETGMRSAVPPSADTFLLGRIVRARALTRISMAGYVGADYDFYECKQRACVHRAEER